MARNLILESFPGIRKAINEYSHVDIIPHLVIGDERQKEEIGKYIGEFGVKSFKAYLNGIPGLIPSVSDAFILDVMDEIKKYSEDSILCVHTENNGIVADATAKMMKEIPGQEMNSSLWADTHPKICESEAVNRISKLAEYNEFPIYIVHLFSKSGVEALENN